MRRTREYAGLGLWYDDARMRELAVPELLTTVRYEAVFREKLGFATIDAVFERGEEIAVAHAVLVDMMALASLEGPCLVWPQALPLAVETAEAIEERIFPWLRTLVRGRVAAGEYVRSYRPSRAFERARSLGYRGAAPYAATLPRSAPFVYARRFAAGARVRVACADAYHAAALLRDVADSMRIVRPCDADRDADAFAMRWYGSPPAADAGAECSLAVVDRLDDPQAAGVPHVVATAPSDGAFVAIVPRPVPLDGLFTFDPADAPEAGRFAVRATDRVDRPVRWSAIPEPTGGSGGRVAFVMREDAAYAPDADTDARDELARRLRDEGLEVVVAAGARDPALAQADLVHIFGGVEDPHVALAAAAATAAGRPYVISVDPIAPRMPGFEEALALALRLGVDENERQAYLRPFFAGKLQIAEIRTTLRDDEWREIDRRFAVACAGAAAVLLAPGADVAAFRARFPGVAPERVAAAPVLLAPEPAEESVAERIPARPFALLHGPLVHRSNQLLLFSALGAVPFGVVLAGPVSDIDLALSLRRVAPADVVILPDPTPATVAALYRRAAVFVDPSLRPTGAGRVIRAALSGALPVVPRESSLAALLDPQLCFGANAPAELAEVVRNAMTRADRDPRAARLAADLAPSADQRAAFDEIIAAYARAAAAASA